MRKKIHQCAGLTEAENQALRKRAENFLNSVSMTFTNQLPIYDKDGFVCHNNFIGHVFGKFVECANYEFTKDKNLLEHLEALLKELTIHKANVRFMLTVLVEMEVETSDDDELRSIIEQCSTLDDLEEYGTVQLSWESIHSSTLEIR